MGVFLECFIYVLILTGREELLPTILCGDMNCTPGCPLYNFILNSSLDYSKMSAVEIAGFHKRNRNNSRVIPNPLLPPDLNIGSDCKFTVSPETQFTDGGSGKAVDEVIVVSDSECDPSIGKVVTKPTIGRNNTVIESSHSQSSHAGAASSRKLDQKQSQPYHVNSEIGNKSEAKEVEPPLSATGTIPWKSTSCCSSSPENKPRQQCLPNKVLTHPFKFQSTYPYSSQSHCSTVTTFHQSAFEQVDYIFYTPAYNLSSAIKEQKEHTSKSHGFHLLSRKVLPSTRALLQLGPQPHEFLSSDHLFLQATFQLVY